MEDGYLKQAQNSNFKYCSWTGNMSGRVVPLKTTESALVEEVTADSNGYFTFSNVSVGTYKLMMPPAARSRNKLSHSVMGTCVKDQPTFSFPITVTGGVTTSVTVEYN